MSGLRFADERHGFAFGTTFHRTRDGGATWEREDVDGEISALEVREGTVIRVVTRCDDAPAGNGACSSTVERAPVTGGAFATLSTPQIANGRPQLDRQDERAWLTTVAFDPPSAQLLATFDGGDTWTVLPMPCERLARAELAAANRDVLYLVCGAEPTTGQQDKEAWASNDGGHTWQPRGTPPTAGYLEHAAATPAGILVLAYGSGSLVRSTDGARTFTDLDLPFDGVDPYEDPWYHFVGFVDDHHGHAIGGPRRTVWNTTDGGATWTSHQFPAAE